jgi:hypothetical protein
MEKVTANQTVSSRNQSTVKFERKNIFLFGNRYVEATFLNKEAEEVVVEDGLLLVRDIQGGDPTKVVPVSYTDTDNNNLADIIGVSNFGGQVTLAASAETNCNCAISGDIDAGLLTLPDGVTLDTVVGNKILKDVLTDLGFVLFNVTENSKFDN